MGHTKSLIIQGSYLKTESNTKQEYICVLVFKVSPFPSMIPALTIFSNSSLNTLLCTHKHTHTQAHTHNSQRLSHF